MANQITDNRTSIAVAQTSAPASETWEASGGGGSIVEDTDIFIEGTTAVAEQISSSRRVMLYDNGSDMNLQNTHVYIWVNCGIVGLLDIKANGGMTVRFTGATSTDFFEFYVGGSDSWPTSVAGGWTMFVVDVEGTASNTNGTPPATSAVRKVGISAVTAGTMTKAADNTWVDAIWSLADATPGIIVEGRNGGSTDWDFADIVTQLGTGAGTLKNGPGGSFVCNTPIQFGINDTTTHGFTDTNQILLWEDQEFAATDLYALSALGNSGGTTNVTLGVKTGTGDDATGAQGVTIAAASTGVRWAMDFDDPDLDLIAFYGCQLIHGGTFQLDDPAVSFISCLYIDCDQAVVSDSEQLRCSVINANTADGVAFMQTNDISDIVFCSFEFSDGHAVELIATAPSTQTSKGNLFTGYATDVGNANDRALYNNSGLGSLITVNVTEQGDGPSVRNAASQSTSVQNTVTITVTVLDGDGNPVEGARVRVQLDSDGSLVAQGSTNASGVFTDSTFNFASNTDVLTKVRLKGFKPFRTAGTITANGLTVGATVQSDSIVDLP